MQLHRVVDAIALPAPLDPLAVAVFLAFFAAAALLTARRPSYGLAALILADPFALSRDAGGTTITIAKVVLAGVIAGLLTYRGNAARLRQTPAPRLALVVALVALATALSIAAAAHLGPAVRETMKAVQYLLLFAVAFLCYRLDDDATPVVGAVALVTIVVSLTALAQEAIGAPSALCIGAAVVPRIAGLLDGPNQLAAYLETSIAILGAWSLARNTAWLAIALGLAVCTAALTFSRSGFVATLIVLATLAVLGRPAGLRQLWAAWIGALVGLCGDAAWSLFTQNAEIFRLSIDDSFCAGGVGNRAQLWPAAWHMWLAHPLLGVGAGNFELELPDYGVLGVRTHANSWYLQSLAEGGVALFAAVVALIATVLATFGRALREGSPWVLAGFAATLALALHQIVDYVVFYPKVGSAWFVLLGIGTAAIAARRRA